MGPRRRPPRPAARALAAVLVLLLAAGCLPAGLRGPYPLEPVALPRDEGAHPAPIEWWYVTGRLRDEAGRPLGFELTFFRAFPRLDRPAGRLVAALLGPGHVAHAALTEPAVGRFRYAERTDLWGYPAGAAAGRLEVFLGDWRLERPTPGGPMRLAFDVGGDRLELELEPLKPAALHGAPPGVQAMGPGGISYYLSYTRLRARGTLTRRCGPLRCRPEPVEGVAWLDHQWGDFDVGAVAGWDWFALQLDGGDELMLYLIRGPDGRYVAAAGSHVGRSGRLRPLAGDDLRVAPLGTVWTSPATGAVYPLGWRVTVRSLGLELEVRPLGAPQELDTRASTGIVYWEGMVEVAGDRRGGGYVELTNYDRYPVGAADAPAAPLPPRAPSLRPFGGGELRWDPTALPGAESDIE